MEAKEQITKRQKKKQEVENIIKENFDWLKDQLEEKIEFILIEHFKPNRFHYSLNKNGLKTFIQELNKQGR